MASWASTARWSPTEQHLNLTDLFPAGGVPKVAPVTAPPDYVARYARFESLIDIRQANFTPDLPTAAGVITQQAKRLGWGSFDGIFMVDTVWMQYMLEATGPINAPGWGGEITADNVIDILGHQLPALPSEQSNTIQEAIGRAVWHAVQTKDFSPSVFATALARSVNERHMQLWSANGDQEALIRSLGAAGDADLGKNPLYVVWEGIAASKVGIYAERQTDVDVTLAQDGTATVTTTIHVKNSAPNSPPSDLLGDGQDFPVGTFAGYLSTYLPEQVEGVPTFSASAPTVTGIEEEFGHKVAIGFTAGAVGRRDDLVGDLRRTRGRHRGGGPTRVPHGLPASADVRTRACHRDDPSAGRCGCHCPVAGRDERRR